jgi:pSer/pThr/pTyr-binding forkhead associated (FHA) protein
MKDGIWAEIIDDKIIIGGHMVIFSEKGVYINHTYYSKETILAHKAVLELGHTIFVGCNNQYELTLETVNKILSKL